MDSALLLKQKVDSGEIKDFDQAAEFLDNSLILKTLLDDFDQDILNLINRLTEISEIPFACRLEKVQLWVNNLADLSFCDDGFSVMGESDDLLSCYNSMITSVLIRMNYADNARIMKGIDWILKYQNVERGAPNKWGGSRVLKYGGCMKNTPCYIGIVKAMIALSDFKRSNNYIRNDHLEKKLATGLEYILNHQVYLRQSNGQSITKYIDKLTYPFSYKTNVLEILRLLKVNNLDSDKRCDKAKEFLQKKKHKDGYWRANRLYLPKFWIPFDKTKEPGQWISYEVEKVLNY